MATGSINVNYYGNVRIAEFAVTRYSLVRGSLMHVCRIQVGRRRRKKSATELFAIHELCSAVTRNAALSVTTRVGYEFAFRRLRCTLIQDIMVIKCAL